MPGHLNRSVLLAKVVDIGKTVSIKANDPLIPLLSSSDPF
jgi:hypothetical protein